MKRLVLACALLGVSTAQAQFSIQGELEGLLASSLADGVSADAFWTVAGHLEANYALKAPLETSLTLVLDPSVRVGEEVAFEAGLTGAYALVRRGELDLSAGVERLPLETARLSVPFSVEPRNARSLPEGVPGVRATWYRDAYPDAFSASWRVRGALLYTGSYRDPLTWGALTPLLSVRGSFGGFELEASALYTQKLVAGLGGSGLVGDTVLYGEAWVLTDPLRARGALGASGYVGERLWTLEAAYPAPLPNAPSHTVPVPQLAGQLTLLQGEATSLSGDARLLLRESGLEALPTLSYTALGRGGDLTLTAAGRVGAEVAALSVSLGVKSFF